MNKFQYQINRWPKQRNRPYTNALTDKQRRALGLRENNPENHLTTSVKKNKSGVNES